MSGVTAVDVGIATQLAISADFLVTWASTGYGTESDLFLARAVLQLLCLGNLRAANVVRERFISRFSDGTGVRARKIDSPLANFIRFVLLTLEVRAYIYSICRLCHCGARVPRLHFPFRCTSLQRDARPLYETLLVKYAASLARDPSFKDYTLSIGMC